MAKYKKINPNILGMEILLKVREKHVSRIAHELISHQIIPFEYIDNMMRIDYMRSGITITHENQHEIMTNINRIKYLNDLLQKECSKGTAKIISGNK